MNAIPLVTIMIATKDRAEDLAVTLRDLRRQDYEALELIVIDDASTPPIASIVKEHWPAALVVRHDRALGQAARRNEGFRLAKGKYILQLDDDCSLASGDGIARSVEFMEGTPGCTGIAYHQIHGSEVPAGLATAALLAGHCLAFSGSAVFLRRKVIERTAGYREFYIGYGEEGELALQFLKLGGSCFFLPEIIALHRCSPRNRNGLIAWKRSLRNNLWTVLLHSPLARLPVELGWKVASGFWDAFRLQRWRLLCEALGQAVKGLGVVWRLRDPLDRLSMRRYDILRAYGVLPDGLFTDPPPAGWKNWKRWARQWRCRLREESVLWGRGRARCDRRLAKEQS